MSKLGLELQQLGPSAIVDLYELDLTPDDVGSSNKYYFHSGTNELSESVTWQAQVYTALPIQVEGFVTSVTGQLPRLKVSLANIDSVFTALILDFDDMLGAKLTRHRTFAKFLDAVNFTGGVNADADPSVELPDEIFYAQRKITENKAMVEVEFATKFDLEGVQLPRRQVTANLCSWLFRGPGCRYALAPVTDIDGAALPYSPDAPPYIEYNPATTYATGDVVWYYSSVYVYLCKAITTGNAPTDTTKWVRTGCVKTLAACKAHFGATASLPFGAFPGVARMPQ